VSVIVGAYNHEPYITQALTSVITQVAPFGVEIIVIEDASTDGTLDAIVEVQMGLDRDLDTTMTVFAAPFNLDTNRGLHAAIERSHGEFVATLDGDDYWSSPHKLARQVQLMRDRPELSMCIHPADYLDDVTGEIFGRSEIGTEDMGLCDLVPSNQIPACSALFRRSAIDHLPAYFDEAPYGDLLLYFEAALHGPIGIVDETMGVYRFHRGGMWNGAEVELRELRWIELLDNARPEVRERCAANLRQSKGDAYRLIASSLIEEGRRGRALRYALRAAAVRDAGRVESLRLARHALPTFTDKPVGATIDLVNRLSGRAG
jgi:glycosyltransferase involved in cell wall biosynthesis